MANGDSTQVTDPVRPLLDPLQVDKSVKHDAWDAFHKAKSPQEFRQYFDKAPLPQETKKALWNAKFGSSGASKPSIAAPPAAPKQEPHSTFKDWDLGLQEGTASSFGIQLPDPNHPESLTWHQAASQLASGTKSFWANELKKNGPFAPIDGIVDGIEGMASSIEQGTKQAWTGQTGRDKARGIGLVLGSLGQVLGGAEGVEKGLPFEKVGGVNKIVDSLGNIHGLTSEQKDAAVEAANKPPTILKPMAYGRAYIYKKGIDIADQLSKAKTQVKKEIDLHAKGVSDWIDTNVPGSIDAQEIKQAVSDSWKASVKTKEKPTPTMVQILKDPEQKWGFEKTKQLRTKLAQEYKDAPSPVQAVIGATRNKMKGVLAQTADKLGGGLKKSFDHYNNLQQRLDTYSDYVDELTEASKRGGHQVAQKVLANPKFYNQAVAQLSKYGLNTKDALDFAKHSKWFAEKDGKWKSMWRIAHGTPGGTAGFLAGYLATKKYLPAMAAGAATGLASEYLLNLSRALRLDPEILKIELRKHGLEGKQPFAGGVAPPKPPSDEGMPGVPNEPVNRPPPRDPATTPKESPLPGVSAVDLTPKPESTAGKPRVRFETDSSGARWAVGDDGVRVSVKDQVSTREALTALDKQREAQAQIKKNISNKPSEVFAVRRGPIEEGGAYFSTKGESTYFDPSSEGVEHYKIKNAKIADTGDESVRKSILNEALKDKDLTESDRTRIHELLKEDSINYIDNDELPLPEAAKRLGYQGIKVWENDDITGPSSVFLWDTSKAEKIQRVPEGQHGKGKIAEQAKARERVKKQEETAGSPRSQHYGQRRVELSAEQAKADKYATHGFDPQSIGIIEKEDFLKTSPKSEEFRKLKELKKSGKLSPEQYDEGVNYYFREAAEELAGSKD